MTRITRRAALQTAFGGVAACAAPAPRTKFDAASGDADPVFAHGVASGDPGPDSVVLWTRVSIAGVDRLPVAWEVSADAEFSSLAASGETIAEIAGVSVEQREKGPRLVVVRRR